MRVTFVSGSDICTAGEEREGARRGEKSEKRRDSRGGEERREGRTEER